MNTRLSYSYTDAANYSTSKEVVLMGFLEASEMNYLVNRFGEDGEGFIPSVLGLEDLQGALQAYDQDEFVSDELDHCFHEVTELSSTEDEPNAPITARAFYLLMIKTDWFAESGKV